MLYLSYLLAVVAIIVMGANVILAFRLKNVIIGGEVGERWKLLTYLILFFLFGYILAPLLLVLSVPVEVMGIMVFAVFLFGAIFVAVVIRIIKDTLEFMDLLKEE